MRVLDGPEPGERAAEVLGRATGRPATGVWSAPGRVNLMGEHTDYNDGFVLPFALPMRCCAAAALDQTSVVTMRSLQQSGVVTCAVSAGPGDVGGWAAYVQGVVWAFAAEGHAIPGLDVVVDSDVPLGAGLSSSAAIECAVALAIDDLLGLGLDGLQIARLARRAENDFVGAPTGVMDQTVSMLGRKDHLLFLDTRSMQVDQIGLDLAASGLGLLVVDTRAEHRNVDGAYGERRAACVEAARRLGVPALRDVSVDGLDEAMAAVGDDALARRLRHVVSENARVLELVAALRSGVDPRTLGATLTASHASMRDDFEISVPELDVAVEAALAAGAFGARMTGGGFGGCTVSLVEAGSEDTVASAVQAAFADHGFGSPTWFGAAPGDGAHRVR